MLCVVMSFDVTFLSCAQYSIQYPLGGWLVTTVLLAGWVALFGKRLIHDS